MARADKALDVYGAGKATYDLGASYAENGAFEREDAWNLLSYVPFAGAVLGGIKKFFSANKAIKGGAESTNELISTGKAGTEVVGQCFVAGTKVITPDGEKNIEDIQVGDWVLADDPNTPGGIVSRQVADTFVRETSTLVDLYVDGEVISTTEEHPFWVPGQGWVEAQDLQIGSLLQTDEETFVDVDRIEKREGKTKVYNFSVEGIPTYFVSEHGILVHNACGGTHPFGNLSDNDLIKSSQRPARSGAEESRGLQGLKKKIDRGNPAFSGLPKTQETADDIIREVFNSPTPVVKTGTSRNGEPYTDIFNPDTGRGVRIINDQFDTFVNLH